MPAHCPKSDDRRAPITPSSSFVEEELINFGTALHRLIHSVEKPPHPQLTAFPVPSRGRIDCAHINDKEGAHTLTNRDLHPIHAAYASPLSASQLPSATCYNYVRNDTELHFRVRCSSRPGVVTFRALMGARRPLAAR